jgi:hypothetical protein
MKTRIETREYVIAHGRAPRGYGNWAFTMRLANGERAAGHRSEGPTGWHDGIYWVHGNYGDAKRAALREGRRILAMVVSVGS